ncbi:MAG: N-6 DNA methylase [Anaerolineales bacterium]|jgi:adenine-specific DNA-methyltransferase|nr:N-6 DNA methylase [Anaerolineales bacterium]MDX9937446.1 BsuBI/PstI family type II restriction endonuclease [Anaerolineales bacterium]GER80508.1 type II restriction m6 adenine DNA methyltransferase [Candidatus Denitrolinea symbiosum]
MEVADLVAYSYEQGKRILEKRESATLKEHGQFLTPPAVARYMAKKLGQIQNGASLLEPACGSGVLVCALIEQLIAKKSPLEISIIAYETDKELAELSSQVLELACQKAEKHNIKLHWQVFQNDFILACLPDEQPSLFGSEESRRRSFDFVISNPPYFKLNTEDTRVKVVSGKLNGHTNIYTLFMALSAKLLSPQGKACFIVPRSFCSGVYFSEFRRDLLKDVKPLSVHLFQSRNEVFKGDDVLQENIVFSFEKSSHQEHRYWAGLVNISVSANGTTLNDAISRQVSFKHFLRDQDGLLFFRLPTGILDEQILDAIDRWDGSLEKYGLQVSTGRVVPFRAKPLLQEIPKARNGTVPLLWMQNVKPYQVEFPLERFDKPQAILANDPSLLVPCSNYVLLRRFSAKEDRRRLISAPFISEHFDYEQIGFENHLNVISKKKGALSEYEAIGLAAILNSAIMDRYVRVVNGNTQVNAAEIRALPLPPLEIITELGKKIEGVSNSTPEQIDRIIFSALWQTNLLAEEFPMIQETRITMGKIEQAQEILESLGLPSAQQNEISALTLLALAQLSERSAWKNAANPMLRVHDILIEIKQRYGREYAENSRETIRRRVLHQFEQAGIVIQNADDPTRPTNSGLNNYMLSDLALDVVRTYASPAWNKKRKAFLDQQGRLLDLYQKSREQNKIPLQVADGTTYRLSPGKHNELQSAIVTEFGPRFAPGAKLLYLGDTAKKTIVLEMELLANLYVPASEHGKFADIILYDEKKNWLYLIEAVTAHGPVSPKRHVEMEELLEKCTAGRIYVTAFLDFATFKKFSNEIAWETEVWIAELPSHMIHFNGDKFLGPR